MYRAKQTVVDCGTCELSFSPLGLSPSLSLSLPDFRAYRFILQLLSNRLACVCVFVCVCVCVCVSVRVAEQQERCGREKGVQVLNSLLLSRSVCVRGVDGC